MARRSTHGPCACGLAFRVRDSHKAYYRAIELGAQPVEIPVRADAVSDTRMASTISVGGDPGAPKVQTIEHFMSACCGLGIDNLVVDITAEEVPILDGSAAAFVFLLQSAGIELQDAPKRFLRMLRAVEVREGEGPSLKWARLEPFEGYRLTFEIDFDHPAVNQTGQHVVFDMGSGQYKREIARARTFGFTKDVEMMRARGLGLGGNMDNVIVVDDYRVLTRAASDAVGVPYIDMRAAFMAEIPDWWLIYAGWVTIDGEHPNARGTQIEAELFATTVNVWLREPPAA